MNKSLFGTLPNGEEVYRYTLCNQKITANILDFGCILQSLYVPDRSGKAENVVLGFDNIEDYLHADGHFGEVVGRVCNRIKDSKFTLEGTEYLLPANDGKNHLHGGPAGFGARLWTLKNASDDSVCFEIKSPHMDMGYPGNLTAVCTYTLTADGKLILNYKAECDRATPVCLTNHSYFDLCGAGSGRTLDMEMWLDCDRICNTDTALIPDGTFTNISKTPYDFSSKKAISRDINEDFLMLRHCNGYDTNYFVKNFTKGIRDIGCLSDTVSGRTMKISTDLPCIQLYTGNMISEKGPEFYSCIKPQAHMGVCLETQYMPDAVNHPDVTDPVIRPGEIFDTTTIFDFGD